MCWYCRSNWRSRGLTRPSPRMARSRTPSSRRRCSGSLLRLALEFLLELIQRQFQLLGHPLIAWPYLRREFENAFRGAPARFEKCASVLGRITVFTLRSVDKAQKRQQAFLVFRFLDF